MSSSHAMLSVAAWFVLNMAIANLNKWIFHQYEFQYPAILTLCHMLSCFALSTVWLRLRGALPMRPLSENALRSVRQLSLVFVVSVAAGNAALHFIHVSFAQAIGATAPLWTVLLSVLITRRTYPPLVYASLLLISAGMVLTTRGEKNFHAIGFALVLLATVTRALKSIMQGLLLGAPDERLDPVELLFHMSQRSAAALCVYALLAERGAAHDDRLRNGRLWGFVVASSLVAFFLNVAQFLVTRATSAVTLQVLGNVKVVLLIGVSVAIFGNEVSMQGAVGCALCLIGVALYNYALRAQPAPPPLRSKLHRLEDPPIKNKAARRLSREA